STIVSTNGVQLVPVHGPLAPQSPFSEHAAPPTVHVPRLNEAMTSALSAAEPGVMPAAASSLVVYAIVRSALNTPASIRWSVTKNGRTPAVPTVIAGPGGTSASAAPGVAPRIERPAVTRVATAFVTKSTTTSGVGSGPASAPPWSTVRAKKVAVDAPAG